METPAKKVRDLLGVHDLAEACGITTLQVYRWDHGPDKGGAGGNVPSRHHATILALAKKKSVRLTIADINPDLARAAQ